MDFEWDEAKSRDTYRKRGIDFGDAILIFQNWTFEILDDRCDYGEKRTVAYGESNGHVLAVVYTTRGDVIRIISARKADRNERRAYYAAISGRSTEGAD